MISPRELETLATSDAGVALMRRIWRKSFDAIAAGRAPKLVQLDPEGIFEVDTFKGFAKPEDIRLGPQNMPSSKGGLGLIRNTEGKLVF